MDVLADAFYRIAVTAVALALATGLGLLLAPKRLRALTRRLDRWHSLRPLLGPLDKPRYIERHVYRHHRLIGAAVVACAGYTLLRLATIDYLTTPALLPAAWNSGVRAVLGSSGYWFLLFTNLGALGVGLAIYFRPSLLKALEARSNRWLSTRQAIKPLDVSHNELNVSLWNHPRLIGGFLLLGSLYVLTVLVAYRHGFL